MHVEEAPGIESSAPAPARAHPRQRTRAPARARTPSRSAARQPAPRAPHLCTQMGKVRVRQHVNPLRAEYLTPLGPIDWAAAFEDPGLPLVIDLGCGPGRFLLLLQRRAAAGGGGAGVAAGGRCNFLGVEIRRALVDRANQWAADLGVKGRVHYVFTNATISLATMLQGYPGEVQAFYVQFPDPHFKKKHKKRRLLQPDTVRAMAGVLRPGGVVFLQSDILQAAEGMRDAVESAAADCFELAPAHADPAAAPFASAWAAGGWLRDNPVGTPTEREHYVTETQDGAIYRVLLLRK
ncbi:MAG: putative methyltransferase-domain-containing protein [Monoraphidium minutum]|nr:MAG: putative methyltransferase-domain-containing protein [Monoraphidium minutum]